MQQPLVSIVMPALNHARFIAAAIDSVLGQSYANLELIVADGGSTDGTRQLLAGVAAQDSRLRWHSERDNGPAQALNRAMARARGTIIGWLNSDDLYVPGAVDRAMAGFAAHPEWLLLYGQGDHVDVHGHTLSRYPTLPPTTPLTQFAEGCFICQPTVFFRRTAQLLLGRLDEQLRCSFDFDYWLRAFSAFPQRIGFIDVLQAQSRLHDDCLTLRQRRQVALEGMQLLHRHLGAAPKEWLLTYADELLALPAHARGVQDLAEHFAGTLNIVKPWLAAGEFSLLQQHIKEALHAQP
jgi:glycosyltransferase involved in cell wall biosynthesis